MISQFLWKPDELNRSPDKGAYLKIIFLICKPNHMLWVLKQPSHWDRSFDNPKHMFKLMGKEIFTILPSKVFLINLNTWLRLHCKFEIQNISWFFTHLTLMHSNKPKSIKLARTCPEVVWEQRVKVGTPVCGTQLINIDHQ